MEMEGHNSSSFAGKNQPPPGGEKYCKSLKKERQNLKDESLPQVVLLEATLCLSRSFNINEDGGFAGNSGNPQRC